MDIMDVSTLISLPKNALIKLLQLKRAASSLKVATIFCPLPQFKTIKGTIISNYLEPIPFASVVVEGTNYGNITDIDGNFELEIPKSDEFNTLIVPYGKRSKIKLSDGTMVWLNSGSKFPDAPLDMYYCSGFKGQFVFIIPSKELVIVRTGLAGEAKFDINEFLLKKIEKVKLFEEKLSKEDTINKYYIEVRKGIPKIQPDLIKKWKEKVIEKMIQTVKVENAPAKPAQSVVPTQTQPAPAIQQKKNVEKKLESDDDS